MTATTRPLLRRIAFLRRNRCGVMVAALGVFILANAAVDYDTTIGPVLALTLSALVASASWAVRGRRLFAPVLVLALATALVFALAYLGLHGLAPLIFAVTAVLIGTVTVALLYYVLDWHTITADKVFGAVAAYVLIAFTFASLFSLLQVYQPNAFTVAAVNEPDGHLGWHELMYFSFTVLTSTGFGEITPVSNMARSLIVIEQVLGVMYVAFLVARLANLYGRSHAEE